jgi:hypothetical protein
MCRSSVEFGFGVNVGTYRLHPPERDPVRPSGHERAWHWLPKQQHCKVSEPVSAGWMADYWENNPLFHLLRNLLVDGITEILDRATSALKHDRCRIIRCQSSGFRVDANEVQCLPHHVDKFIDVQPFSRRYWHGVWDFVSVEFDQNTLGVGEKWLRTASQVLQSKSRRSK